MNEEPSLYFDQHGEPITWDAWAALRTLPDYHIVGRTEIGGVLISTVWLGINHGWFADVPPVIFETMAFGETDCQVLERYCTLEQAQEGHERHTARVTAQVTN